MALNNLFNNKTDIIIKPTGSYVFKQTLTLLKEHHFCLYSNIKFVKSSSKTKKKNFIYKILNFALSHSLSLSLTQQHTHFVRIRAIWCLRFFQVSLFQYLFSHIFKLFLLKVISNIFFLAKQIIKNSQSDISKVFRSFYSKNLLAALVTSCT